MVQDDAAPIMLPLSNARATLDLVGGKDASLAQLAAAGFPVPPGFHITTAGYQRFVAGTVPGAIVHAIRCVYSVRCGRDGEWVIRGNDLLVVQASPITTLPEPAAITSREPTRCRS